MTDSTDSTAEDQSGQSLGMVPRPRFHLRSLPIRYRWEATRRHPYYQNCWRLARAHYQNDPAEHPAEPFLRQAAVAFLAAIDVSGAPPDPAIDFDQLDSE